MILTKTTTLQGAVITTAKKRIYANRGDNNGDRISWTRLKGKLEKTIVIQQSLRSLDYASVATLVHAFVTSRVDYCNCLLAGATKASLDKLQRVMNAAARVAYI